MSAEVPSPFRGNSIEAEVIPEQEVENRPKPTEEEIRFESAALMGIKTAKERLHSRFETPINPDDKLEYHVVKHSIERVMVRVERFLLELNEINPQKFPLRYVPLGKLIASFHDTVQEYKIENGKRVRFAGSNERKSAEELVEEMKRINTDLGNEVFTAEDMDFGTNAILATVPTFGALPGSDNATVYQNNLTPEANIFIRVLGLADLATAGMEGYEGYAEEGDQLFREENLDIRDAITAGVALSEETKQEYKKRMLNWTRSQISFAKGRQERLETELDGLEANEKEAIRRLFDKFENSISKSVENYNRREGLSFEDLAADMGFKRSTSLPN